MTPIGTDAWEPQPVAGGGATTGLPAARPRRRATRWLLGLLVVPLALCLVLGALRGSFVLYRNGGDGMTPTLGNRDLLLINRGGFSADRPPNRGDLVLFDPPTPSGGDFVKRVIGLSGETIAIRDGKVYINDVLLNEPYMQAPIQYRYPIGSQTSQRIPEGSIFVLGDNRNNSADSHIFGPIALSTVKGRVSLIRPATGGWPHRP